MQSELSTTEERYFCILSDGTGETAEAMVRAALLQFATLRPKMRIVRFKKIRSEAQVDHVFKKAQRMGGVVVHTLVSGELRNYVKDCATKYDLQAFDLLGPLLSFMTIVLKQDPGASPGLLHQVDDKYFDRISAIEYTVKHDDGRFLHDLDRADVVLVGISRTSKTPLSIFLSHKGYKVGNIPIVKGIELPKELFAVDQRKIVALEIDGSALVDIRKHRISKMGPELDQEYASERHVLEELEYAQNLFRRNKLWPVFNVTGRALEELAVEIENVIQRNKSARAPNVAPASE